MKIEMHWSVVIVLALIGVAIAILITPSAAPVKESVKDRIKQNGFSTVADSVAERFAARKRRQDDEVVTVIDGVLREKKAS